jgi:hypothetical protein
MATSRATFAVRRRPCSMLHILQTIDTGAQPKVEAPGAILFRLVAPGLQSSRVVQVFAAQTHECFVYPILIGNALDIGIVRRVRR